MKDKGQLRVLLVEDHPLIAVMTAELLVEDLDCIVIGPARSVREAERLAESERPDLALVDMNLPDGSASDLVPSLRAAGVACVILSAYTSPPSPSEALRDVPWLEKPVDVSQLERILDRLRAARVG